MIKMSVPSEYERRSWKCITVCVKIFKMTVFFIDELEKCEKNLQSIICHHFVCKKNF